VVTCDYVNYIEDCVDLSKHTYLLASHDQTNKTLIDKSAFILILLL